MIGLRFQCPSCDHWLNGWVLEHLIAFGPKYRDIGSNGWPAKRRAYTMSSVLSGTTRGTAKQGGTAAAVSGERTHFKGFPDNAAGRICLFWGRPYRDQSHNHIRSHQYNNRVAFHRRKEMSSWLKSTLDSHINANGTKRNIATFISGAAALPHCYFWLPISGGYAIPYSGILYLIQGVFTSL